MVTRQAAILWSSLEWKITSGGKTTHIQNIYTRIYVFLSHLLSSFPFSLPAINSRNSDPGSLSRLFPPLPATVRALHFYREKISAISSLDDSRRIEPSPRYKLSAVDPFYFLRNNFDISPRRDSHSRTNTIRGLLPLDYRGDTTHTGEAAHIQ